ncbi:MAG: YkgJ family cysteine cluster protein, partial [Methanobacteriales archaeon HGW-Methanobacteriales-2]
MLRDLLINKELFETLREKFLESDDGGMNTNEEIELLEKAVFN